MKKSFTLNAKVWCWPGDAPWHFVNIDKNISEKIRSIYTKGFVRVRAKVGKTSWETSLFPHKLSGAYLLSIKASVRKKESIFDDDIIKLSFEIL